MENEKKEKVDFVQSAFNLLEAIKDINADNYEDYIMIESTNYEELTKVLENIISLEKMEYAMNYINDYCDTMFDVYFKLGMKCMRDILNEL